jgi:RND superfamily putative drug exporter
VADRRIRRLDFGGLGRFVVQRRFQVAGAWVAAALAAVIFLPPIGGAIQSSDVALLPSSSPSMRALALAHPFGVENFSTVLVVVHSANGRLDSQDAAAVSSVERALERVRKVEIVQDLGYSANGRARLVVVESSVSLFSSLATERLVDDVEQTARSVPMPPGLHADVAGEIADTVASQQANQRRAAEIEDAATLMILLLLILIFRAVMAPILIFVPAAISVAISQRVVAEMARFGVQVSDMTQMLLIALVLGAGTDYGIFLGLRVREELRRGADFAEAIVIGMRRVGESIAFSALTVITALLCLLMASFGMYRSLGVPLAVGLAVMLAAGLTLTPALLAIVGERIFWPAQVASAGNVSVSAARPAKQGYWAWLARLVVARPLRVLGVSAGMLGILAVAALWEKPGGTQGALSAPSGSSAAAGDAAFAADWPGVSESPTSVIFRLPKSVWADPSQLVTLDAALSRSKLFNMVLGPLDPISLRILPSQLAYYHAILGAPGLLEASEPPGVNLPVLYYESYRATRAYISADGHTVQFAVSLSGGPPLSTAAISQIPAVRHLTALLAREVGSKDYGVTGQTAAVYDVATVSQSDFWKVVPLVVTLITILVGILLRSLVSPLYLVASVTLSLFATLGVAVLVYMVAGHQRGIFFMLPFGLFIFLLALGEDYNILLMSRVRDEARRAPLGVALTRALTSTGSTISAAGLVMAATFGVLAFSGDPGSSNAEVQQVGMVLAVGIVMDTFVVRSMLVPSLVRLLGRLNWWPSKLSRRHAGRYERYGYHFFDLLSARSVLSASDRVPSPPEPDDRAGLPGPVLVLTASLGAGHDGVARELARRLEACGHDTVVADFCSLLPVGMGKAIRYAFAWSVSHAPRLYGWIFGAWLDPRSPHMSPFRAVCWLLRRRVGALVVAERPSLALSTFNLCSHSLGEMRLRGELDAPAVSVVVDFHPHGAWVHPGVDMHLCLDESAADVIRKATGGEVLAVGPTVRPEYEEANWDRFAIRRSFGIGPSERVALVVGGSWGVGEVVATVTDLLRVPSVVPMVVCGRNRRLASRLEEMFARAGRGMVFGWVRDLSPLMVAADVLIENAGGLTCMEALSLGLPVVSYRPIPGHGRRNVEAMAWAGVVRHAKDQATLAREIEVVVTSPRERLALARRVAAMRKDGDAVSVLLSLAAGWWRGGSQGGSQLVEAAVGEVPVHRQPDARGADANRRGERVVDVQRSIRLAG